MWIKNHEGDYVNAEKYDMLKFFSIELDEEVICYEIQLWSESNGIHCLGYLHEYEECELYLKLCCENPTLAESHFYLSDLDSVLWTKCLKEGLFKEIHQKYFGTPEEEEKERIEEYKIVGKLIQKIKIQSYEKENK